MSVQGKQYVSEVRYHDIDYCISVFVSPLKELHVFLEQVATSQFWAGIYSMDHIKQLTLRSGTSVPFERFVEMLLSGLAHTSHAVTVDVLTYDDAQRIQQEREQDEGRRIPATGLEPGRIANRRYLVIQYSAEFHKVSYPLPLTFQERPDPAFLIAMIRRLREQLAATRAENGQGAPCPSDAQLQTELASAKAAARAAEARAVELSGRCAESEATVAELRTRLQRAINRANTAEQTMRTLTRTGTTTAAATTGRISSARGRSPSVPRSRSVSPSPRSMSRSSSPASSRSPSPAPSYSRSTWRPLRSSSPATRQSPSIERSSQRTSTYSRTGRVSRPPAPVPTSRQQTASSSIHRTRTQTTPRRQRPRSASLEEAASQLSDLQSQFDRIEQLLHSKLSEAGLR